MASFSSMSLRSVELPLRSGQREERVDFFKTPNAAPKYKTKVHQNSRQP